MKAVVGWRRQYGPPVAEGVEKVRTIKFGATIVRASRACCNIDSTKPQILKHCFKNFERPDFFNTLRHKKKSDALVCRIDFYISAR
ncbi:MAG: hypothetical protein IIB66_03185 [Proteobacteria bacterium]|nr:hypothetical protein [Pseudomonadota bacterium]